jgi:hypothetical protein
LIKNSRVIDDKNLGRNSLFYWELPQNEGDLNPFEGEFPHFFSD